jgi:hypothetical protein
MQHTDNLVLWDTPNELQQSIYILNTVTTKYKMEMSAGKTKVLAF